MKSVAKLKQKIKNIAKQDNIPHEILYQNFFFERFLERLSISKYKDKMIIKGGFLLTSLLGIENRSTADIDLTIDTISMDKNIVRKSIDQIIAIDVEDDCTFEVTNISKIRHEDKYEGLRVTILGEFHNLRFHFKLDLSTGDQITPSPVNRLIKLNISDKQIDLFSYNFETVLAEKLQTIISRGIATTRAKDYFDVYSIITFQKDLIDLNVLKEAFNATMKFRGTNYSKQRIVEIMDSIKKSDALNELWNAYKEDFFFAHNIEFETVYLRLKKLIFEILN